MAVTNNTIKTRASDFVRDLGIKIPAEHGAAVTFVLSSLGALYLAGDAFLTGSIALLFLVLMGLTLSNNRTLIVIASSGALLMTLLFGKPVYIAIFAACLLGCILIKSNRAVREILGLFGVTTMPFGLVAAGFDSSEALPAILIFCLALSGAAFGASFVVHYAVMKVDGVSIFQLVFFLLASSLLWTVIPALSAVLLLPIALELLYRMRLRSLGFKRIGLIQTAYVTLVAITAGILL